MKTAAFVVAVAGALTLSAAANADVVVSVMDAHKVSIYTQDSAAPAASSTRHLMYARLFAADSLDPNAVSMQGSSRTDVMSPIAGVSPGAIWSCATEVFSSRAELDLAQPNNSDVTYRVSTLNAGSLDATVRYGGTNAPSTIAHVSNWGDLQGMNASFAMPVTVNSYTPSQEGASEQVTTWGVYRRSDGAFMTGNIGGAELSNFTIPANILSAGTDYVLNITFAVREVEMNGAFFGGRGSTFYGSVDHVTEVPFSTAAIPTPAVAGLLGLATMNAARRRR
jgi:hypothetical protein